ncbi:hypothetical protein AZI86_06020 [Bdellovibrio bacteriovorus]|uniref:Purine nucleoside phosphorylase n=1 Tax=Bdellovibrio bacteriovorus TaxID=959 RepID=A0A150WQM4_BDEBC|nr:peptidoglycan editing factor PgeF [Bdellovibrio bacteriovorus]KYG66599.1 hypothetical protein AZI86_06020 [Bdellovibrio bacteriovorus]
MNLTETAWGYELKTEEITILFGAMKAQTADLRKAFPDLKLTRLKQIHSDAILETHPLSPDYEILGDAHWTKAKNLALGVITADCVPVFLFDSKTKIIAGIHAGWRGVASKIIPKTIEKLSAQSSAPQDLQVFIGPHIQKNSFEIGIDVRDQILSSLGPLSPDERHEYFDDISKDKVLLDLHKVVLTQLNQSGVSPENTHSLYIDTVKDSRFHSYRRDKEKAGRQVSFICRTS